MHEVIYSENVGKYAWPVPTEANERGGRIDRAPTQLT